MARKAQHYEIEGLPFRWAKMPEPPEVYRGKGVWEEYEDMARLILWGVPADADEAVRAVAAYDVLLGNPPTPYDAVSWLAAHEIPA